MAEIPVTKKSGLPWWAWALLAALVVLLLFLFLGGGDDAEVAERDRVETVDRDAGEVSGLAAILAMDPSEAAGNIIELEGLTVARVVGDRSFVVRDAAGTELFAVLDEVETPGTPTEGRYDVNAGQTIDLEGELFEVEDGMIGGERIEDLPADVRIYVYVSEAEIGS